MVRIEKILVPSLIISLEEALEQSKGLDVKTVKRICGDRLSGMRDYPVTFELKGDFIGWQFNLHCYWSKMLEREMKRQSTCGEDLCAKWMRGLTKIKEDIIRIST